MDNLEPQGRSVNSWMLPSWILPVVQSAGSVVGGIFPLLNSSNPRGQEMTRLTDLPGRRSLLNGFTLCAAGILLAVFGMAGGARAADESTETLTMLTVDRARELAAKKGDLRLNKVSSLSPEVAAELATLDGRLFLNGLKELPLDVARALVAFKGDLSLNGLTALPEELAAVLGSRASGNTDLNGLPTVEPAAAKKFDTHRGCLCFYEIKSMSDETAAAFESFRGYAMVLTFLTDISDEGVMSLARSKGQALVLGITTLSPEAAAVLGQRTGIIKLPGLRSLSDEAAKNLVQNSAATVYLSSKLTEISPEALELLRSKKGIVLPENLKQGK